MKSKSTPWYTLARLKQEDISKKVKTFIDEYLLDLPEVKRKMDEKTEYLLVNQEVEISTEHDIKNWVQFLPPLFPFSIKNLNDISSEFKAQLKLDLVNGLPDQREKILEIQSKIIMFSLAIQEKIHTIINKKTLLLTRANNEAYLENSCCNEKKNQTTIQYFEDTDSSITECNNIVNRLTNLMIDISNYSKAILLFSNINTKNIYPPIPKNFDDKTIFLTFIHFCHFKTLIPIDENLLPLCVEKPTVSENDSSEEVITKLKLAGKKYSNESFLRLLQLVSQQNTIHIDISLQIVSSIDKLLLNLDTIDPIDPENYTEGKKSFKQLIKNSLDTFTIASETVTQETKDLNNFLIKNIASMKTDIIDFITKNRGIKTTKRTLNEITSTIENISDWKSNKSTRNENTNISNDSLYGIIQFFKTFIQNIVKVFPNIILNKVFINYIDLAESDEQLVRKITKPVTVTVDDLVTTEYLDDLSTRIDVESSLKEEQDVRLLRGNKKEIKIKVSNLLVVFIQAIEENRHKTNYSYENILDLVFKIKEREKNNITSRLQGLTDEEREADTILKVNKLGLWSKGLQKGLTTYVKDTFDEDREDMEKMMQYEKNLAQHNRSTGKNLDMDQFMEGIVEEAEVDDDIEADNLDYRGYTGDDGNYEEEDQDNDLDFDS
jgi:hypothetical protein